MTQANPGEDLACPHCGNPFILQPGQPGRAMECKRCRKQFTAAGSTKVATVFPAADIGADVGKVPMNYAGSSQTQDRRGVRWIRVIVLCAVSLTCAQIFVEILASSGTRHADLAYPPRCESNLKQIGMACIMYCNSHKDGALPDSFDTLIRVQEMQGDTFVCDKSSDVPSSSSDPAQIRADIAKGGHCSYMYAGKGLTINSPPDSVLVYESSSNHKRQGMNVLYLDGHVQWLDRVAAQNVIAQFQAGVQLWPATARSSRP